MKGRIEEWKGSTQYLRIVCVVFLLGAVPLGWLAGCMWLEGTRFNAPSELTPSVSGSSIVTLMSPNGGGWSNPDYDNDLRSIGCEVWQYGQTYTITWQLKGDKAAAVAYVVLSYSSAPPYDTWTQIETLDTKAKSFEWAVPDIVSTRCLVRCEVYGADGVLLDRDLSDKAFVICSSAPLVKGKEVDDLFLEKILETAEIPVTQFAVEALQAWRKFEGTNAYWNPFATTLGWHPQSDLAQRSWHFNQNPGTGGKYYPVQNYVDADTGIKATASTLTNGRYAAIVAMLRMEGFDKEKIKEQLKTWGTGDKLVDEWEKLWNKYEIQRQIEQAKDGEVIQLRAGTFSVNLRITKSLTLKGAGPGQTVLLAADPKQPVVSITAPATRPINVELSGVAFRGATGNAGVGTGGAANVKISECTMEANAFGLIVGSSSTVTMKSCTLRENGAGVALAGTGRATISSCTISRNTLGMRIHDSSEVSIFDCKIEYNAPYDGIWLTDSAKATDISRCTIRFNGDDGIELRGNSTAKISNCHIEGNGNNGVSLIERPVVTIESNTIRGNGRYGVECEDRYPEYRFRGCVSGRKNTIPGPTDAYGNKAGSVYPLSLLFLTSQWGGKLDLR